MTALTAADYADTGQWRLIVRIYRKGMSAYLENTLHQEVDPQELFSEIWDPEKGNLLNFIENAVYDHPRVLDDFSARIIVYDRNTIFIPTEVLLDSEESEETIYSDLFGVEASEVMTESDKDIVSASCLVKGLKGFLNRTFPGARMCSNLMHKVKESRKEGEGKRMKIEVREGETDFVLLDGEKLISASTHDTYAGTDVAYHAFNLLNTYELNPKEVKAELSGTPLPDDVAEVFETYMMQG